MVPPHRGQDEVRAALKRHIHPAVPERDKQTGKRQKIQRPRVLGAHFGRPAERMMERRADRAAQRLLPAESVGDDQFQHFGQPPEVEQHDAQRQHDVPQRHNRDDHAADTRNAPYASEDDEQRQRREHDAHPHMIGAESSLPRGADRVALHRVEGESEGHGDQHGEQHAHPPPPEAAFHVVGRTADERVPAAAFVKLCEGRLDESARGAHKVFA